MIPALTSPDTPKNGTGSQQFPPWGGGGANNSERGGDSLPSAGIRKYPGPSCLLYYSAPLNLEGGVGFYEGITLRLQRKPQRPSWGQQGRLKKKEKNLNADLQIARSHTAVSNQKGRKMEGGKRDFHRICRSLSTCMF